MQNLKKYGRIGVCVLLVLVVFVIFELRLLEWQVFRHQEYSEDAATTGSLFVKLEATRGEILDKDGNVLAGNKTVYNVVMNALTMEKDRNPAILSALKLFKERDIEWIDRLPIEINEKGEYIFKENRDSEIKYLKSSAFLNIEEDATAAECMELLTERYRVSSY